MNGRFAVEHDGATLIGEGTGDPAAAPLILVHGFGGSRRDWDHVVAELPEGMPTLRYDQRGFGDSLADDRPYSHADDLLALVEGRGIAMADVCGMSLGGATALAFALDHPERVRRLVLVSPLIVGWTWSDEWIGLWKAIGRRARAGDIDGARELWLEHPLFAQVRGTPAEIEARASIAAFHGNQWIADPARDQMPDIERLHELSVPALLLTGALDMPDFRLIAELIAGAAPVVTRIDYAGAGHMLTLERPREIATEIARFLV